MKRTVAHQIETAGQTRPVFFARQAFQGRQYSIDLALIDRGRDRVSQTHDVLGSLQIGELGGIVLHRLEQCGHCLLRGLDLVPFIPLDCVEYV